MRVAVTVLVFDPPAPVMAMVYEPGVVLGLVLIVSWEFPEPGAAIKAGLTLAVTPFGKPDTVSDTALLKPPITVAARLNVPEAPCVRGCKPKPPIFPFVQKLSSHKGYRCLALAG